MFKLIPITNKTKALICNLTQNQTELNQQTSPNLEKKKIPQTENNQKLEETILPQDQKEKTQNR